MLSTISSDYALRPCSCSSTNRVCYRTKKEDREISLLKQCRKRIAPLCCKCKKPFGCGSKNIVSTVPSLLLLTPRFLLLLIEKLSRPNSNGAKQNSTSCLNVCISTRQVHISQLMRRNAKCARRSVWTLCNCVSIFCPINFCLHIFCIKAGSSSLRPQQSAW